VKFMAAIGAFLGWQAVIFSLMLSAMIGAAVGLSLVALKRGKLSSSRLPYGPYIALAAVHLDFWGPPLVTWWLVLGDAVPRLAALGLVAEGVIEEDQGGHGFDEDDRAREDAGVVAAAAFQGGVAMIEIDRKLFEHDGGDRFETDTE